MNNIFDFSFPFLLSFVISFVYRGRVRLLAVRHSRYCDEFFSKLYQRSHYGVLGLDMGDLIWGSLNRLLIIPRN